MSKSTMFVLSVIIGGTLLSTCDDEGSKPPGGGLPPPVGGEGESSHGEGEGPGEGEGEGRGEGEGEDGDGTCNTVCEKRFAQDDWISTCVAGVCQCFRNLWRDCGPPCQQFDDGMLCLADYCAAPAIGFIECNAQCVDSLGDNAHCGACGNTCRDSEQCVEGQCSRCPDAREQWCPKMWGEVACVNVQNDPANCGTCGVLCQDFGYHCDHGACVCRHDADHCEFDGVEYCTDLKRDWDNCGQCGNQCPRGSECFSSQCGACVQSWDLEQCNGACVVCNNLCALTAEDPLNCGECGNRCALPTECNQGRCGP